MRAMVYHGNKDLRLESVPDPIPAPGEVKLRIDYCGICATDIEEYTYGPVFISHESPNPITGKKIPMIIGHEMTGTITEKNDTVSNINIGDRVAINGVLTCKKCWWCTHGQEQQCQSMGAVGFATDGGLAEYMVWPGSQVISLPDTVSSRDAALVEPGSVALHAVRRSRLHPKESIAVLGVGTVGMLAMQVAKAIGARVFAVDRRDMSLNIAKDLGADATINPDDTDVKQALLDLTKGVGPDVIIDAAGGKNTPPQSIQWVRRGGRVVLVAIYTSKPQVDFNDMVIQEGELLGSLAYQQQDVEEIVRMISSGSVKTTPLISDEIGLEDVINVGFDRMMSSSKDVFRILVNPSI